MWCWVSRYTKPLLSGHQAALDRLHEDQAQVDEHMRHRKIDQVMHEPPCAYRTTFRLHPTLVAVHNNPLLSGIDHLGMLCPAATVFPASTVFPFAEERHSHQNACGPHARAEPTPAYAWTPVE